MPEIQTECLARIKTESGVRGSPLGTDIFLGVGRGAAADPVWGLASCIMYCVLCGKGHAVYTWCPAL